MTEERKEELIKFYLEKDKENLESSLGMAIHFEMWERAAIIRDCAKQKGIVLTPTPWDNYIDNKIKQVINE